MTTIKHASYCRKEKEIAEMQTDLKNVKKAVMGNGKGLNVTVPLLSQTVEKLEGTVVGLQKGLSGFLKFQENLEGRQAGKAQVRKRTQWIIGTLVFVSVSLLGVLVTLILKMP